MRASHSRQLCVLAVIWIVMLLASHLQGDILQAIGREEKRSKEHIIKSWMFSRQVSISPTALQFNHCAVHCRASVAQTHQSMHIHEHTHIQQSNTCPNRARYSEITVIMMTMVMLMMVPHNKGLQHGASNSILWVYALSSHTHAASEHVWVLR